jgi:hypothetical protein
MDFVERLFHVSPDGGNGTFELALVAAALAAVAGLRAWRGWTSRRAQTRRPSARG